MGTNYLASPTDGGEAEFGPCPIVRQSLAGWLKGRPDRSPALSPIPSISWRNVPVQTSTSGEAFRVQLDPLRPPSIAGGSGLAPPGDCSPSCRDCDGCITVLTAHSLDDQSLTFTAEDAWNVAVGTREHDDPSRRETGRARWAPMVTLRENTRREEPCTSRKVDSC